MPVRLDSKLPQEQEARIEIIPLIDIMFFLLASFMLVSLSMVNLKSVKVDLPTATTADSESDKKDLISLSVDASGTTYFEQDPVGSNELATRLSSLLAENPEVRVLISGDVDARHGDVIRMVDIARRSGIQRVAFEIRPGLE